MVYDVGFNDGGPLFWWTLGGHDPIYAFLVAESSVDSSSWTGYHFLAFSLTHLVLPFPVSLFAHDGMPWLIAKVPDDALTLPFEAIFQRTKCASGGAGLPQNLCSAIAAMGDATQRFSHEFVEVAVDPYPFWGWLDPGKVPVWTKGELADICEGKPLPWSEKTQIASAIVPTYWSNADKACMPESRPTVKILSPVAGQVKSALRGAYAVSILSGLRVACSPQAVRPEP
jgi:hypothetical protein